MPFIVGVGASAGGLEPLTELFSHADPGAPTAWVLVQHLSPDHKSFFVEILQRKTNLQVQRAEHLDVIKPGCIYVIEPNTQIRVVDGHIESAQWRRKESAPASSIDILFESLAEGTEHHCAAVILSGSGTDGTRGAGLVREAGGMVVVQDPDTASFDSMPRSAIRAKLADRVLPADQIAPFLEAVARRRSPRTKGTAGGVQSILDYLRAEHGVEFQAYKPDGIQRRLNRRMDMLGIDEYPKYLDRLRTHDDELNLLENDLLIGVTSFFRDLDAFTQLQAHLTEYVAKNPKPEYRVWVVGCSTGEEAYSAAMVLDDVLADDGNQSTIKLFATDLNEQSLSRAAKGTYKTSHVSAIPAHLLGRYFSRDEAGNYRVRTFLREMMLFSRHDVVREPPFSRLDLIICRNLLIYFRPGTQATVLDRFAFGLAPGALLFLGPSESAPADDWDCSNPRWRIYESRGRTGRFAIPAVPALRRSRPAAHRNVTHELGSLHEAITTGRLPPHVITTIDMDVVYRSGHMGSLLSLPQGPISTDLRRMVSRNLGTLMSMAVDRVKTGDDKQVVYQGVREPGPTADVHFDLQVQLIEPAGSNAVFLGFFFDGLVTKEPAPITLAPAISEDVQTRIGVLEDKLHQSERRLQSTVEELESSNEELQATNEELLASNEELQSVNEELQSLNEELHTVNQEHQAKIDQLIVVTSELEQLLQSIDVGVLRLDTELRIQRVNTAFAAYSAVRVEDLGRPLADLRTELAGISTLTMCQQALNSTEPISHTGREGDRTMMLMAQSLSASGKNRGVTLTCTDVTALERAATIEARLVTALNVTALPLAVEDSAGKIVFANEAFARALNREARWLVGSEVGDLMLDQEGVTRARTAMADGHASWNGSLQVSFGADSSVPVAFSATPCKQGSLMEGIVWRLLTPPEAMSDHSLGFGFVAWDPGTSQTWVDPRAAGILGLGLDGQVSMDLLIDRLDAATPNELMKSVQTLTAAGRTSQVEGTTRGSLSAFSWIFRVDELPDRGPIALGVIWQVEP